MKYYGYDTKQKFIQEIYDCEIDIPYKEAGYTFWLDGRGYCVGMTYFNLEGYHQKNITIALYMPIQSRTYRQVCSL